MIERERRFLIEMLPELPACGVELRQGYLAIDGSVAVRVRDAGPKGCTLTVKSGRGAVRTELEWPITIEEFERVWPDTEGRRISKTRYAITGPPGTPIIELDIFDEVLNGLVIAEVEFDSDEALTAFTPASWFGQEVTDDVRYSNSSLATHGLPS